MAKMYIFAVSEEQLKYLNLAKKLGVVIPVASGSSYEEIQGTIADVQEQERGETLEASDLNNRVTQKAVLKWIEDHSYDIVNILSEDRKEVEESPEIENSGQDYKTDHEPVGVSRLPHFI
jgi:hypothetical protein